MGKVKFKVGDVVCRESIIDGSIGIVRITEIFEHDDSFNGYVISKCKAWLCNVGEIIQKAFTDDIRGVFMNLHKGKWYLHKGYNTPLYKTMHQRDENEETN